MEKIKASGRSERRRLSNLFLEKSLTGEASVLNVRTHLEDV